MLMEGKTRSPIAYSVRLIFYGSAAYFWYDSFSMPGAETKKVRFFGIVRRVLKRKGRECHRGSPYQTTS